MSNSNSWGLSWLFGNSAPVPEQTIDLEQVRLALQEKAAILVDVRELNEHETHAVPGSICMPLSWLRELRSKQPLVPYLPADTTLFAHCVKGIRSQAAVEIFTRFEYHAISLPQGVDALIAAGLGLANQPNQSGNAP